MRLNAAGTGAPTGEYINLQEYRVRWSQGDKAMDKRVAPKASARKAVGLAAMLVAATLPFHQVHAAPATGGDTVQGLYDALLGTMKNGRTLGQSGRFTQLEPVIRRSFDIPAMARLSVGSPWTGMTEGQRQQVT